MKTTRHGISIGIERSANRVFLSLKAIGKLNHEDYELITPMIDSAVDAAKDPIVLDQAYRRSVANWFRFRD